MENDVRAQARAGGSTRASNNSLPTLASRSRWSSVQSGPSVNLPMSAAIALGSGDNKDFLLALAVYNANYINIRPMDYLQLPDNAARQVIDSTTVFRRVRPGPAQAYAYAAVACIGSACLKGYQYLVQDPPDGPQQRIGPHSPATGSAF